MYPHPTYCFSPQESMISQFSSSTHFHSSFPFFLASFSSLTRSVYVFPLASFKYVFSLFPRRTHCHLSRLVTSPSFPLCYLRLSLLALAPLSVTFLADIYCKTFLGLSLLGHLQWMCGGFQTVHEDHQGINSPTATIFSKGAISRLSTSAPLSLSSPPPPPLLSSTPHSLHLLDHRLLRDGRSHRSHY